MRKVVISREERREICTRNLNENVYQTEKDLEEELIKILISQGYEYRKDINNEEALKNNLRVQLERLNRYGDRKQNFAFSNSEWKWFYQEYLEKAAGNTGIASRTKKIQGHEFKKILQRDNGSTLNINFIDKTHPARNLIQVINQYADHNKKVRYDVTILVNGLPLVHIELKKRGISLNVAFDQIEKYKSVGFCSLFEFVQIFVISNGTDTKYYSNTTRMNEDNKSFLYTSFWADSKNETIRDLRDFARTFLAPNTILQILTKYCVFDSNNNLKILRPYQIAAIEGIVERIKNSIDGNAQGPRGGGYVWHTTGSGKTLTSFKAAQLAQEIPGVNKVLFVVDRKDLDHQTTQEYRKFLGESDEQTIDNTNNTNKLKELLKDGNKRIIITTIQKLRRLLDVDKQKDQKYLLSEADKKQRIVMIMDECHRSQTVWAHYLISQFEKRHIFGFTGTPKFKLGETDDDKDINETENTFGSEIHSYKIVDAIKDENVLGFWIDYVGSRKYLEEPSEQNQLEKHSRIASIVNYIIQNFHIKTNPSSINSPESLHKKESTFNSMFAVKSIDVAMQYYNEFHKQLLESDKKLKIAIIFSANDNRTNEDNDGNHDDTHEYENMDITHRDFLDRAIQKYNETFNCSIQKSNFNAYRNDVSERVKKKEIDLLIVVNMFLTGFDAIRLNTIWIDKNLEGHNLIQAFSRTNRIYNSSKRHGNIICFRDDLKDKVDKAIAKFATQDGAADLVLAKGLKERLSEFRALEDAIIDKFPIEKEIVSEDAQREFVQLWSKYLEISNALSCDEDFEKHRKIKQEKRQDYTSRYRQLYEQYKNKENEIEKAGETEATLENGDPMIFNLEILRSDEVDVDYILGLLAEYHQFKNKEEILRYVRTSETFGPEENIIRAFFDLIDKGHTNLQYPEFKKTKLDERKGDLIAKENLKRDGVYKLIDRWIKEKSISYEGPKVKTDIMPENMDFIIRFREYIEKWERVKKELEEIFKIESAW